MLTADLIQRILELPRIRRGTVVFLFGSRATGQDRPESDLDLLVLHHGREQHRSLPLPDGPTLDVLFRQRRTVYDGISRFDRGNDSFFLNLLLSAKLLRDDQVGTGAALLARAKVVALAGPPALTRKAAREAITAVRLMLRSAKADRAARDHQESVLCRMRLDQVVRRCVYLFCRARRLRGSSFPETVCMVTGLDPAFHILWQQYLYASDDNRPKLSHDIVEWVIAALRTSTPDKDVFPGPPQT